MTNKTNENIFSLERSIMLLRFLTFLLWRGCEKALCLIKMKGSISNIQNLLNQLLTFHSIVCTRWCKSLRREKAEIHFLSCEDTVRWTSIQQWNWKGSKEIRTEQKLMTRLLGETKQTENSPVGINHLIVSCYGADSHDHSGKSGWGLLIRVGCTFTVSRGSLEGRWAVSLQK